MRARVAASGHIEHQHAHPLEQLGCRVALTNLQLPGRCTIKRWAEIGLVLGDIMRRADNFHWWIGDWWCDARLIYGERRAIVHADDWTGPSYATCSNIAHTWRAFKNPRRRGFLSFSHHTEVAYEPPDEADRLLDWAEETIATTGRPRSTRALRAERERRRAEAARRLGEALQTQATAVPSRHITIPMDIRSVSQPERLMTVEINRVNLPGAMSSVTPTSDNVIPFKKPTGSNEAAVANLYEGLEQVLTGARNAGLPDDLVITVLADRLVAEAREAGWGSGQIIRWVTDRCGEPGG